MDGQTCDRHPTARAKARILFPSLVQLYLCGHCVHNFEQTHTGEYYIAYEPVNV